MKKKKTSFDLSDPSQFWKWDSYHIYLQFLALFTAMLAGFMLFLMNNTSFIESLGYFSLLVEACLPVPQALQNYQKKSTAGLSVGMVGCWFLGDLGKLAYFIMKSQPSQFVMCGFIQLTVDAVIVLQIKFYGSGPKYHGI
eukprot:CAMPEP_0115011084 /NCGR_PEP_ID=MMETSP0216-20121206/23760_1 /TAXON_ID=223996 /ORGANISM="Protocruzia adherens, Strain Boccale" /LENGTH=139 /DNA_ID=CAMNT_0002379541 /DNA_START=250 /DNA_END=669 /DNA_ORIENTATION=+